MDNTPLSRLGGAASLGLALICVFLPFIFPKFPRSLAIAGAVIGFLLMGWQWWGTAGTQAVAFRTILKDYTWLLGLGVGVGALSLAGLFWALSAPPVATAVAPTVPVAAPDPYAKKPLSLRVLFDTDFLNYRVLWTGLTTPLKGGTKMEVPWRVVQDPNARSMFLMFYIPSHPADTNQAVALCKFIALHQAEILEAEKPHMVEYVTPNPGDKSPVLIEDLVFTGTVYLYVADLLTSEQEADIRSLFKSKKLSAVIYSEYYRLVHAQEDRVDPFQQH